MFRSLDIKKALFNPMYIFSVILGVQLPDERFKYSSMVYKFWWVAMQQILMYDDYEEMFESILRKHGITTDDVYERMESGNPFEEFMKVVCLLREDLFKIYIIATRNIEFDSLAHKEIQRKKDVMRALYIDSDKIYSELSCGYATTLASAMYAIWMEEAMETVLKNAVHFDDSNYTMEIMKHSPSKGGSGMKNAPIMTLDEVMFDTKRKFKEPETPEEKMMNPIILSERRVVRPEVDPVIFDSRKGDPDIIDRYIDSARKNVNKMDKKHGVNLRQPMDPVDTEIAFRRKVEKYKLALAKYVLKLNKISLDEYIIDETIFGTYVKDIEISKRFRRSSKLFNGGELDMDDEKFVKRFITYIFAWVIKHLHDIATSSYVLNDDGEFIEYESKLSYTKYTVKNAIRLADKLINGEDVDRELLYFDEILFATQIGEGKKKRTGHIIECVETLYNKTGTLALDLRPFPNVPMYGQAETFESMLNLAYLVSTHDYKHRQQFEVKPSYRFWRHNMTKEYIAELGEAILKSRDKFDVPVVFRSFVLSDPKLGSRWGDVNEDKALAVGVIALRYYGFITGNQYIREKTDYLT